MLSGGGPSLIACHVPYVELLACLLFFLQGNRGWHTTTQIQFNELRMFFFYIFKELLTQTTTTTKAPKQNKGEYAKRDDVATKPKIATKERKLFKNAALQIKRCY